MATHNPQIPGVSSETYTPDRLVAGHNIGLVTDGAVLVSGQNLPRGAVLGRITASGKLMLSAAGASDGSQTPYAILAEDTDASGGDKTCTVYVAGEFNAGALTFGAGHTAASVKDALRDAGIFLKTPVPA